MWQLLEELFLMETLSHFSIFTKFEQSIMENTFGDDKEQRVI